MKFIKDFAYSVSPYYFEKGDWFVLGDGVGQEYAARELSPMRRFAATAAVILAVAFVIAGIASMR